jgi:hypothetical protein
MLLVQEGETSPGVGGNGGQCVRGSSGNTGCYPVLPDADGASTVTVLPDATAPSLASTPDFARRSLWSHAIEVKMSLQIELGIRNYRVGILSLHVRVTYIQSFVLTLVNQAKDHVIKNSNLTRKGNKFNGETVTLSQ